MNRPMRSRFRGFESQGGSSLSFIVSIASEKVKELSCFHRAAPTTRTTERRKRAELFVCIRLCVFYLFFVHLFPVRLGVGSSFLGR